VVAIVAVSYDPVETLAEFARSHRITYRLLSDLGSIEIIRLGLVNHTIAEERAALGQGEVTERHRNLTYPGTFSLDEEGAVVSKRFERHHRIRPTGMSLLAGLLGTDGVTPAVTAEAVASGARVAAWLDSDVVSANQIQDMHVRLALDEDLHVYTEPTPDGYVPLQVTLAGAEVRTRNLVAPPGHELRIAGIPETFSVLDGVVDVALPFMVFSNDNTAGGAPRDLTLQVMVRFQACTGQECLLPTSLALELPIREVPNP